MKGNFLFYVIRTDESIYLVGTLDGHIHAYDSTLQNKRWDLSLGEPLITTNIELKVRIFLIFLEYYVR